LQIDDLLIVDWRLTIAHCRLLIVDGGITIDASPIMPCDICDDIGWKPVAADGVRRVVRCDCWYGKNVEKLLTDSGIPPRYLGCDLDTFRDYNDTLVDAVNTAKAFVEKFPTVDKGLLFLGSPGVGKTHLAVSILKRIVQRTGLRARFYDTRKLLALIRNTYNPVVKATEESVIRPAMDADFVVLDDLGAERPTEWVEETMNLIINTRYNMRRATVFTTNYPEKTPAGSPADALGERIGARIHSRLMEMCRFVEMRGVHYRELPEHPTNEDIAALDSSGSRLQEDLGLTPRRKGMVKAQMKPARELGWSGGKAGS
jgi:DNA replication protein DnaC